MALSPFFPSMAGRYPYSTRQRLRTAEQFSRILKTVRPMSGKVLQIYRYSAGLAYPRLGLIVSKRMVRKAVERNYVKRRIRETFRLLAPQLEPNDYLVRVRPGPKRLKQEAILGVQTDVENLFNQFLTSV